MKIGSAVADTAHSRPCGTREVLPRKEPPQVLAPPETPAPKSKSCTTPIKQTPKPPEELLAGEPHTLQDPQISTKSFSADSQQNL